VPILGRYWRSKPLVFLQVPRCYGQVKLAEVHLNAARGVERLMPRHLFSLGIGEVKLRREGATIEFSFAEKAAKR